MPSSIDISSNALILIGDNPISSFDDPGAGATAAANLYPTAYTALLANHPWSFALKEQELSRLTAEPDDLTGFQFQYQVPTDMVRLWAIFPHSFYTIVGDKLYSNTNKLLSRYVYQVDETKLPPHFVKALEYRLAADFALLVTESNAKSEIFEKKYLQAVAHARTIDSQAHPQTPIIDSPFVDVRLSGRGSLV